VTACPPARGDNGSVDSETVIVDPAAEPLQPRGRIGIKDVLCVGPIIANTIYYYAGLPLTPLTATVAVNPCAVVMPNGDSVTATVGVAWLTVSVPFNVFTE